MRMGISATAHRSVTRVIGPIWPTANRPTIECAPQISVVKTSRRIGLAQTDCMSPVLGAVASVMNVFEGFEDRPKFTVPAGSGAVDENRTRRRNSPSRDGRQIRGRDRSERDRVKRGASDPRSGGLARLGDDRLADRFGERLGFLARTP